MLSPKNLLITGGIFNHSSSRSSGFDLLSQKVAAKALHSSGELCDPARCHANTRVAVLTDLEEWAEGFKYNYPIKWICGSAGVGKTAIMRTISEILEKRRLLLASFFFWKTGDRCSHPEFFISTLSYQIALSIPETRPYIEHAIEENPLVFTQTLEVQSQALIVDPLRNVLQKNSLPDYPRVFTVDGLDECHDVRNQYKVLNILHWTLQQLPMPFSVLISSRPENQIQTIFNTTLKDLSSSIVLDKSRNVTADIKRFYLAKFHEIQEHHPLKCYLAGPQWPTPAEIDILVHRASGHFIYASTVVKFITTPNKNPANQLKIIIDSTGGGTINPFLPLNLLYATVLSTIDEEDIVGTLRVLGALLVPQRVKFSFAPPSFWEKLLGFEEGDVRRLLIGLESLLSVRESQNDVKKTFHFYHASFQDFLFNKKRSGKFFIDEGMVCTDLARRCIHHLFTTDDEIRKYILHNMKSVFRRANPVMELYQAVSQVGQFGLPASMNRPSIRPHCLKHMYPTFLNAVLISRLPGKEKLYAMKLNDYRTLIGRWLPLYFQDERLAFLILSRLSADYVYWLVLPFRQFIDEICPLSIQEQQIDQEGLCLYHDGYWHDLPLFTETAKTLLLNIADVGKWYEGAALRLIRHMDCNNGLYVEPSLSLWVGNDAVPLGQVVAFSLPVLLSSASTHSILIEYLKSHPVSGEYWKIRQIKAAIIQYLSREPDTLPGIAEESQVNRPHETFIDHGSPSKLKDRIEITRRSRIPKALSRT